MRAPPERCPNPDCPNEFGGAFEKSQFEKVEDGTWKCRQCGYLREF